ncbi:Protein UXT Ubiquitously expressed transcript protein [Larimichthys crocea]|uniref:Protein UXT Ubiquitously expressed transcript protein n=1 Tax=Larimichthys crocea TaxID=215358 RepID=A0A6G0HEJ2_LARCR|nr:Protein UXT Ubiquitously expressed transcript protein [Larimichthys crocea]
MSSPDEANANANVEEKILQYEKFISDVMRRDLQRLLEQRDSSLQDSQQLKTDVDLGCNFYVQAEVTSCCNPAPSLPVCQRGLVRIFVAVGYGFFVEMTHEEALRFIDKKTNQLTAFTDQLTKDSSKIKANIRMVLEGLRELQGLSDLPESRRREVY